MRTCLCSSGSSASDQSARLAPDLSRNTRCRPAMLALGGTLRRPRAQGPVSSCSARAKDSANIPTVQCLRCRLLLTPTPAAGTRLVLAWNRTEQPQEGTAPPEGAKTGVARIGGVAASSRALRRKPAPVPASRQHPRHARSRPKLEVGTTRLVSTEAGIERKDRSCPASCQQQAQVAGRCKGSVISFRQLTKALHGPCVDRHVWHAIRDTRDNNKQ